MPDRFFSLVGAEGLWSLEGQVVSVHTEVQLRQAIADANLGGAPVTIQVQPGDYHLTDALWVHASGVTVIGMGASRNDVIIRGRGMNNSQVPHGFWVAVDDFRVENVTIREVYNHGLQLNSGTDRIVVLNVRIQDTREHMLKGAFNSNFPR